MNFYLRADIAKFVAEWQAYINPNLAAEAMVDPMIADLSCLHVPEEALATSEYVEDIGAFSSNFQDAWTNFKLN